MTRTWKDPRDDREWEVEALPIMSTIEPREPAPMFDEVKHEVRFTASDGRQSVLAIVPPEVGMRFDDLSDVEMADLLDQARERNFPGR